MTTRPTAAQLRAQGRAAERADILAFIAAAVIDGRPLTKTAQVRMCGNSVSPVMSEALARANAANDDGAAERAAA